MQEHFYEAAIRHFVDAGILKKEQCYDNAVNLYGNSAECALKTLLGYLPSDSEDAFKKFIVKIIGQYMGKDPKRGISYSWVPNHIQDANGELSPRPFLKCFVFAAQELCAHKLESLGIFQEAEDGRVNVPEIYLHGFGLKRRGGIKRPRG